MKLLFTAIIVLTTALSGVSQSLQVEFDSEYRSNNSSEFPLKNGLLSVSQSSYSFGSGNSRINISSPIAFGMSRENGKLGFVRLSDVLKGEIFDVSGIKLSEAELSHFNANDQTINISVLANGEFILRDNVANYTFFDAAGNQGYSLSNATQSQEGERPSEISFSSAGQTVVLYNPVVQYDGSQGSRASIAVGDRESEQIYFSRTRIIDHLSVSENGNFVTLATSGGNEDSDVYIFDRFGNELLALETGMDVTGFELTNDGSYLTIYSSNRVQVYRTADMERLGSSTSRTSIIHAAYFPEESTIISVGGQMNNGRVSSPEITAIHLELRQIEREELNGTISILSDSDVNIIRHGTGSYKVEGLNRPIKVQATF